MGSCLSEACGGLLSEALAGKSSLKQVTSVPADGSEELPQQRFVWHGGMPMLVTNPFEGGLPQYVGLVERETMHFGPLVLEVETWPDYRIGSMHWPSGRLLARILAEGALPDVMPPLAGRRIAELGAGPGLPSLVCGKLGAKSVTLTDLVELVPLMEKNIRLNALDASCSADTLDWLKADKSSLAAANCRDTDGPLDIVLAADVVYVEEQEPLMGALLALMEPMHTWLVLAYLNRNPGDREYLNTRILPRLDSVRSAVYSTAEDGATEIYVGRLRSR
eukprot:TRINITY_DN110744_c0_g1_i1.p1 TRINITY_DN110744_c0_g1~~TRINITY_DN110744_c0_g1_i1.p1  ORF type:complete len:277 (-),score=54.84 TRINITY_DN110744_c0_g1_i1:8-838(-)